MGFKRCVLRIGALGTGANRLHNLEGVCLELDAAGSDDAVDEDGASGGSLADLARLDGRIVLLAPNQLTLPGQI